MFRSFGFSLFNLGKFPKGINMFGWIGHGVHEQLDIIGLILEIIEWFKILETVHEAIKVLIEFGLDWFRSPSVSRFR